MNVQTMQMDPRIAKVHAKAYRRAVAEHRQARREAIAAKGRELGQEIARVRVEKSRLEREDEELAAAYRAMAKGASLINLPSVMKAAGVQPGTHLPKLAIARATWQECFFQVDRRMPAFSEASYIGWKPSKDTVHRFIASTFPTETTDETWRSRNKLLRYPVKAIVPSIPVHLRPASLDEIFILWDAVWQPAPPVDPLLLKRVSATIFVVLAQWNLTPLEQSILEGRIG